MAASHPLHAGGSISGGIKSALANAASNASLEGSTSSSKQSRSYKVLILTEVDSLTQAAQAALRRTMEKYASSCRLVLLCRSPCRVIEVRVDFVRLAVDSFYGSLGKCH